MIRSVLDYARYFAHGVMDTHGRDLLRAHLAPFGSQVVPDRSQALRSAVGYLLRAQGQGQDGGLGSFHLLHGWGASYPETTGYSIPTLIAAGQHLAWQEPLEAARRAGDWLLSIQRPDGGWQGGRVGEARPSIVFNTAQVIRGLLALNALDDDQRYLDSAARAGRWIAQVQDADGAWRASNFLGVARVYDTYVAAPLLRLHALSGERVLRSAAERSLEWVLQQRLPNGWFRNCDNTVQHNDRPITHTIGYTLDGLIECAILAREDRYWHSAMTGAGVLAGILRTKGVLQGRYDERWQGSEYPIMTGCAQLAIVWSRLFQLTGSAPWKEAHDGMVLQLMRIQERSKAGPPEVHGAMPGSYPLWGRYEKFAFPNWGTKYLADALLCGEGRLPAF